MDTRKAQVKDHERFENIEHVCAGCGHSLASVPFRFGNDPGSLGLAYSLIEREPGFYAKWKRPPRTEPGLSEAVHGGNTIGHYRDGKYTPATSVPLDGRTIRVKCPDCGTINEVIATR